MHFEVTCAAGWLRVGLFDSDSESRASNSLQPACQGQRASAGPSSCPWGNLCDREVD